MRNETLPTPEDALLTEKQVAEMTGLAPQTLTNWRCTRRAGPPFIRLGGRVIRYSRVAVMEWLQKNTVTPAAAV